MSVIYKTFVVGDNYFVYDRNRNKIIGIDKGKYDALSNVKSELKESVIKEFQQNGFLKESYLEQIEHPVNDFLELFMKQQMTQLILQVTQNCNLRCSYCYYVNDTYENRKHSKMDMTFDTAKVAIDLFINQSSGRNIIFIGFYGGEPLMRFDLVKQCVEYIESKVSDKTIFFTMTSNGTMLTDEIIEYFTEHSIKLMVSLDGNKESHDKNRVFADGSGSFDILTERLINAKSKYPDFFKEITFNTVISSDMDIKEVRAYYEENDLFSKAAISIATIQDFYTSDPVIYDDKYFIEARYGEFKSALCVAGRLDQTNVARMYRDYITTFEKLIENMHSDLILPKKYHHGGPCIAGARRLFVDVNGNLFPCERVSENSETMNIGTVEKGLDLVKIEALINVGKITEKECKNCWALLHCKMCSAYADDLHTLDKTKKLQNCTYFRNSILEEFKTVSAIRKLK